MTAVHSIRPLTVLALAGALAWWCGPACDRPLGADPPADDGEEQQVGQRLLATLERTPRRGSNLDRVYGWHVERGQLDALITRYRERAGATPPDGAAWMVVGLLEAQRGRDAAAVEALRHAEELRPSDALASYYLGQSLVLVGRPEDAEKAFERSLQRQPPRTELLEVYQTLARLHQRANRGEKALAVWKRLEAQFPSDVRVREQIAQALADEGQTEAALARYAALAADPQAEQKRPHYRLEVADLKARLGRRQDALADYEAIIGDLPVDDWLAQDARRRLEETFLRQDESAELIRYYEKWLTGHPGDVPAVGRLAHFLTLQGRNAEAIPIVSKALVKSPRNAELRLALIGLLVAEQQFAQAVAQYEQLDRIDPDNPDLLREWGRLLMRDDSQPEAQRRTAAAAVWRRMLPKPPKSPDPVLAGQVGELFRQAGMTDDALELYRLAVKLAPTESRPRSQLGEFLHSLGRKDDALAAWRGIAEGPNRDSRNLAVLADVLAEFGYLPEALAAIADACTLSPDEYGLRLRHAELLLQSGRPADALAPLDVATGLAANAEQSEQALRLELRVRSAAGNLKEQTAALQRELDAGRDVTSARWYRLARYYEAVRQWPQAVAAIRAAAGRDAELRANGNQATVLAAAARIYEASGDLSGAAETFRRLAQSDRRGHVEHLARVARLEAALGRRDEALRAGRDLVAAAPGSLEHHQYFANLCFQFSLTEEGLDVLRRAVRANPNDPAPLAALARAFANQFRTGEALELYWRAFNRTDDIEARLPLIDRLAELYLRANQFDRLVERLARQRRSPQEKRVFTLCLSRAHQAAGDLGTARRELEGLLAETPGDSSLLRQLVSLAERESDLAAATLYQRRLAKVAPREAEDYLATLLLRGGEIDEAVAIWSRQAGSAHDTRRLLMLVDNLLFLHHADRALPQLDRLLHDQPRNWEALFRRGMALMFQGNSDEAAAAFEGVLALSLPDDDLSVLRGPSPVGQARTREAEDAFLDRISLEMRVKMQSQVQVLMGGAPNTPQQRLWTPADFGQARLGSLAVLAERARGQGKLDEFLTARRAHRDRTPDEPRAWWDWLYLSRALDDYHEWYLSAREMIKRDELVGHFLLVYTIDNRARGVRSASQNDKLAPLSEAEIAQLKDSYRAVRSRRPDWVYLKESLALKNVLKELRRVHRDPEATELLRDAAAGAKTSRDIVPLLELTARGDPPSFDQLIVRLQALPSPPGQDPLAGEQMFMAVDLAINEQDKLEALPEMRRMLDRYLLALRRRGMVARAPGNAPGPPTAPLGNHRFTAERFERTYRMDQPLPRDAYDWQSFRLTADVLMLHEKYDRVADLMGHLARQAEAAGPGNDAASLRLVLAGICAWTGDLTRCERELALAQAAAPQQTELLTARVQVLEALKKYGEAFALVEAMPTPDAAALRRREESALRLAVRTRNVTRARAAAERLFGLSLDSETQLQLVAQMRQLGMNDLAETVLARIQVRAGNQGPMLLALMQQLEDLGQTERAAEVALQLLHLTPRVAVGRSFESTVYRPRALQVLNRTGKLPKLITRAEAQIKASPRSPVAHQDLIELLEVSGDRSGTEKALQRFVQARPDDAVVRLQAAESFLHAGNLRGALEHFRAAFQKDPTLFARAWSSLYSSAGQFARAGLIDDYAAMFESIDLKRIGSAYAVAQPIEALLMQPATQSAGVKLFALARKAYPDQQIELIEGMFENPCWSIPEVASAGREALAARIDKTAAQDWSEFRHLYVVMVTRADGPTLTDLAARLERAVGRLPNWRGGRALLALVYARRGESAKAIELLDPLTADPASGADDRHIAELANALAPFAGYDEIQVRLLRRVIEAAAPTFMELPPTSFKRMIKLCLQLGLRDEARQMTQRIARAAIHWPTETEPYRIYNWQQLLEELPARLIELDLPLDAVRLLTNRVTESQVDDDSQEQYRRRKMAQQLESAAAAARQDEPAETLAALVRPADGAVELLLLPPRGFGKSALASLLEGTLAEARRPLLDDVARRAGEVLAKRPDDFAARVAATLIAAQRGEDIAAAAGQLVRLTDQRPLSAVLAGTASDSVKREEAARRVELWLVARVCLARPALRQTGRRLGAAAVEAARGRRDVELAATILNEWADLERKQGDAAAAHAAWAQLHEVLLGSSDGSRGPVGLGPPMEEFDRLMQFAYLAAQKDESLLSMRTTVEALSHGPPIRLRVARSRTYVTGPFGEEVERTESVEAIVQRWLAALAVHWQRARVADDQIYEVLANAVLPEGRPNEIFLFTARLPYAPTTLMDAGHLLANWAVKAGRVDDLIRRVEARQGKSGAELPGLALRGLVAVAAGDSAGATAALVGLNRLLQKPVPAPLADSAMLVAQPLLDHAQLGSAARPVVDRAAARLATDAQRVSAAYMARLALAKAYFKTGEIEAGRRLLADFQRWADQAPRDSYRDDRHEKLSALAAAQVDVGLTAEAWATLGHFADLPPHPYRSDSSGSVLGRLAPELARRPAPQRYEFLKNWVIPPGGSSVRFLYGWAGETSAPPLPFGLPDFGAAGVAGPALCTYELLIDAAVAAGRLDELVGELKPMTGRAVDLLLLARLRSGAVEELVPDIRRRHEALGARLNPQRRFRDEYSGATMWVDYFIARACLDRAQLRPVGLPFAETLQMVIGRAGSNSPLAADLRTRIYETRLAGAGLKAPSALALRYWLGEGPTADGWVEAEGHLACRSSRQQPLWFACPLEGDFEIAFDAIGSANITCFGAAFPGLRHLGDSVYENGTIVRRSLGYVNSDGPNQYSIRIRGGKVRLLINSQSYFAEAPANSQLPWLKIAPDDAAVTLRNFSLTGKPAALREVRLSGGETLAWSSTAARPLRGRGGVEDLYPEEWLGLETPSWTLRDGVITGRAENSVGPSPENVLTYEGPLRDGWALTYEFYQGPDRVYVHPAVGQTVFLLDPDGVRLRKLRSSVAASAASDAEKAGVSKERRGPDRLPLKSGAWNTLRLELRDGRVRLELNGVLIFEHTPESTANRTFSLVHTGQRTEARVRDVRLTGGWPADIPAGADLTARAAAATEADRRASEFLIGEVLLSGNARAVLSAARTLPESERFDFLARCVLPSAGDRRGPRLYGVPPAGDGLPEAPAVELLQVALRLNRLDKLVTLAPGKDAPVDVRRAHTAWQVLLAMARADDQAAVAALAELTLPPGPPLEDAALWPVFLAARTALDRPALRAAATATMAGLARRFPFMAAPTPLGRQILFSHGLAQSGDDAARPRGLDLAGPVVSEFLAPGNPPARWVSRGGELDCLPGVPAAAFSRFPLTGDFAATFELGCRDGRILSFGYGGMALELQPDGKTYRVLASGVAALPGTINPPLDFSSGWQAASLTVRAGTATFAVGGRTLHTERVPSGADPWLTFRSENGRGGGLRGLAVTGPSTPPDALDLLGGFNLAGWQDLFGEDSAWERRGAEVRSRDRQVPAPQEAALIYRRPLPADAVVDYEFFQDPGRVTAHPVLGRVAFILAPEGVRLHRLTAGRFDTVRSETGNLADDPGGHRGPKMLPLRPGEWNRVQIALKDSRATLRLNNESVYEYANLPTEPVNFGLFHFADQTRLRVRNVRLRSPWPGLPAPGTWLDPAGLTSH